MGKVAHSANEKRSGRGGRRDWDGYPRGGPIGDKYVKVCPPPGRHKQSCFWIIRILFYLWAQASKFSGAGGW